MERRTNESPMDFEWERRTIDPNSPFQLGLSNLKADLGAHNSRAQNNFTSPTKPSSFGAPQQQSIFATPSHQIFGELRRVGGMGQQPPATPLFQTAQRNLFAQSRQNGGEGGFGGGDPFQQQSTNQNDTVMQSPPQEMDISNTPDTTPRPTAVVENQPPPTPQHSSGATSARMDILTTTTERISGRGELRRGKFSDAAGKRILKRKGKSSGDFWALSSPRKYVYSGHYDHDEDESESDGENSSDENQHHNQPLVTAARKRTTQPPTKTQKQQKANYHNQSTWDHHFPVLASSYLQLAFNIIMVSSVVYLIVTAIRNIQADVDANVQLEISKSLIEVQECQFNYIQNRCDLAQRLPVAKEACAAWDICMNKNPEVVGRARISAHTFATIANSLVEPISYKFMIFFTTLFIGGLWATNSAFGSYRRKMVEAASGFPPGGVQQKQQQQRNPAPQHHQQAPQQLAEIDLARWAQQANIYPPPMTPGRRLATGGAEKERQLAYYR